MKLTEEGKMIAERLRYLDGRKRDAMVFGKTENLLEFEMLQKKAAAEAVKFCKRERVSYWDFLKEVGI